MNIGFLQNRKTCKQRTLKVIKVTRRKLSRKSKRLTHPLNRNKPAKFSINSIAASVKGKKKKTVLGGRVFSGKFDQITLKRATKWFKRRKPAIERYTDNRLKSIKKHYKINKKAGELFLNKKIPVVQKYLLSKVKNAEKTVLVVCPRLKLKVVNGVQEAINLGLKR